MTISTRKQLALYVLLLQMFGISALAQTEKTLFHMHGIPQSTGYNPAKQLDHKVSLSLPGISSVYASIYQGGSYNKVVEKNRDNENIASIPGIIKAFKKNPQVTSSSSVDILGVYINTKKVNFNVFVRERVETFAKSPQAILEVIQKGNTHVDYLGKTISIEPKMGFIHWREFAVGGAYSLSEKLTLGANVKVLFGIGHIRTNLHSSIYTENTDNYPVTFTSGGIAQTSGIINLIDDDIDAEDYFANFGNPGFAIDLGATYQLTDKIQLEASILDIGRIQWKSNLQEFRLGDINGNDRTLTFDALNLATLVNEEQDSEAFEALADSLEKVYTFIQKKDDGEEPSSYSTGLPVRTHLAMSYELTKGFTTGAIFSAIYYKGVFQPGFGINIRKDISRWVGLAASYSIYPHSYTNMGLGVNFNLGPVQLYAVSDQMISGAFGYRDSRSLSARVGLNLVFGHKMAIEKRKERNSLNGN
ncbi:DUF5723 family protein [Rapidithrix thailandica]|uniref:DUF5723 family protein n=1 Tax=Rapidithrix thailandica TaxID=413964 RepID=A0AAW9RP99_9BACT